MQVVNTNNAPQAIGSYNQAMVCGNTVYISGQIPLDKDSMQICSEDIGEQIQQVFDNLSAVCEAAGGSLQNIAKLTIYLTDLSCFNLVNEIMAKNFNEPYPARAAVEVKALPKSSQVEMDAIMVLE